MAKKGTSKTSKRITNTHKVTGTSPGQYKATRTSHNAHHAEPVAKAHGQAKKVNLGTQPIQQNTQSDLIQLVVGINDGLTRFIKERINQSAKLCQA